MGNEILCNYQQQYKIYRRVPVGRLCGEGNLYNSITNSIATFENNCEGETEFRGNGTKPNKGFIRLHPRKENKINKEEVKPVVLYPNPARTNVTVTGKGIKQIEIFDVMGKKVMAKELNNADKVNIDITTLNKGLFLVRVIDINGKINTNKLLVE